MKLPENEAEAMLRECDNHFDDEMALVDQQWAMTLEDAAREALWDLQQWTKDHPAGCECFTCGDSIPDLKKALPKD